MGIRILVVEDDELIATSLVRGLREEGFTVEHAADGAAAWSALQSGSWDLVILDWWLPSQDGLSVLRRFRERDHETPVLFLTARDSVSDRVRGLNGGADDYLCKPFAFDELLARIRALLRRSLPVEHEVLELEDLVLAPSTRDVSRSGVALELTAREFELLEFFMRHPRQVLSRDLIFARVWGADFLGESNVIDVHIMRLRDKLESGGGARLIHTMRGAGYSLRRQP